MDELPMDDLPDLPAVAINQTVRVGFTLKRELERAARELGGDATWLARKILREQLDVQGRALWPEVGDE
jgi:hypothetical protein